MWRRASSRNNSILVLGVDYIMMLACFSYEWKVFIYFLHFKLWLLWLLFDYRFCVELLKRVSTTTAGAVSLGGGPGSGSGAAGAGETLGGLTRSRSWLCCPADRNNRSTAPAAESNHDAKPQVSTVRLRPLYPPAVWASSAAIPTVFALAHLQGSLTL